MVMDLPSVPLLESSKAFRTTRFLPSIFLILTLQHNSSTISNSAESAMMTLTPWPPLSLRKNTISYPCQVVSSTEPWKYTASPRSLLPRPGPGSIRALPNAIEHMYQQRPCLLRGAVYDHIQLRSAFSPDTDADETLVLTNEASYTTTNQFEASFMV